MPVQNESFILRTVGLPMARNYMHAVKVIISAVGPSL